MAVLEAYNGTAGSITGGGSTPTVLTTTIGTSPNCWAGGTLKFDAGTATVSLRGVSALIASNTTAAITMQGAGFGGVSPSAGDTFVILPTAITSALYTLTADIGGGPSATVVFGHGAPSQMKTQKWNQYDVVTEHWGKVGSDSAVTWNIHLISGPVTSFQLFPASLNLVSAINGGNLTILAPVFAQVVVVINGDWKNRINLQVFPSGIAPAGGAVTFNGSQSTVADGTTLVFEPGRHVIPGANSRFLLGANVVAYMKPGAYVVGTFDTRNKSGWSIGVGGGSWSGEGVGGGGSVTQGLPYSQGVLFTMCLGTAPGGPASEAQVYGNSITNVTIVDPCYFFVSGGAHTLTDCMLLADWYGGCGGVGLLPDFHTGAATWARCISVNADDHWQASYNGSAIALNNIAFVHLTQSCLRFGYKPNQTPPFPANAFHTEDGGWVVSIALKDQSWYNPTATNPIVGVLLSGDVGQDTWTIANRATNNLIVEGSTLCELFEIKNGDYPWPNSPPGGLGVGAQRGQAININFLNVSITGTQGKRSTIRGRDVVNTPHDLSFINVSSAGVLWTKANWATYVDQDAFAYNIFVNGVQVGGVLTDAETLWEATKDNYSAAGLISLTNIYVRDQDDIDDDVGVSAAQHVLDLWPIHAQNDFDVTSATHVAVGVQAVIAVLWRRGGSATQIEQVKWETVFGDDGLLGKVRKTGPRAHGVPAISGNTKSKSEGTLSGRPIQPWADTGSLPVNFPPMAVPFDDVEG